MLLPSRSRMKREVAGMKDDLGTTSGEVKSVLHRMRKKPTLVNQYKLLREAMPQPAQV